MRKVCLAQEPQFEVLEVVSRRSSEFCSFELSNGDYVRHVGKGRYYCEESKKSYGELSLFEYDDEGKVVSEVLFIGFKEIEDGKD